MRLRGVLLVVVALAGSLALAAPASASGDDYPDSDPTAYPAGSQDPWGFVVRDSTSFVAWRVSQSGFTFFNDMSNNGVSGHWGDAAHWDENAATLGLPVGSTPTVGAVAQWHADERSSFTVTTSNGSTVTSTTHTFQAGPSGHVAVVTKVNTDGSVVVEQYDADQLHPHTYTTSWVKAPRFIYINVTQPQDTGVNPLIKLSQVSSRGVVTLTIKTYVESAGRTTYFFRRSGITGKVVPLGTAVVDSSGIGHRTFRASTGQILSLYAKDTGVPSPTSPYSNTISFKVR